MRRVHGEWHSHVLWRLIPHIPPPLPTSALTNQPTFQYNLCDFVLLFQVYYYRALRKRPENQPLLDTPPRVLKPLLPAYLSYPLMLAFVVAFGFIGLELSGPSDDDSDKGPAGGVELEWKSQALGYASCFLYLGSRVPQIFHNRKTRCQGLSLAMFFFSITGNVTYVASILSKSLDRKYVIANLSWIAGAGLTIFLDLYVLGQFAYYSWHDRHVGKVFADDVEEEV